MGRRRAESLSIAHQRRGQTNRAELDWATPGRVVEHSVLTVQEAQMAIEWYEAAVRQARGKTTDSLETLKQRVLAASTDGTLQARTRTIVEENRKQAVQRAAA